MVASVNRPYPRPQELPGTRRVEQSRPNPRPIRGPSPVQNQNLGQVQGAQLRLPPPLKDSSLDPLEIEANYADADNVQSVIQRQDPQIEAYRYGLIAEAKRRAEQNLQEYLPAYTFATTPEQGQLALQAAERGLGAYEPYLSRGANTLQSGADIAGGGINALNQASDLFRQNVGAPTQQQLNAYLNPYQDAIQGEINRSFDIQSSRAGLQAAGSPGGPSAYGGSRAAIQQAEIGRNRAQALAQSQAANFLQAQRGVQNQFGRGLQAAQGLGQLGAVQGAVGQGIGQIGTSQANLAAVGSGVQQQGIAQLAQLAEQQRLVNQGLLDADRQTHLQQLYEPYQRLGFYSDILSGIPTSQQSISTSTSPKPGFLNQLLGAGIGGLSAYGALRQLGGFG